MLLAAMTESAAYFDGRVVCTPIVAVTLASHSHVMSFVELGSANSQLGKRYHLRRSLFSLSHAGLQAAWSSESEMINCRC